MALLDQISNAQDKSTLQTALQSSMEVNKSDLDAIKTEIEGKVWTTKDQLANFMNEIYDKLYDRTGNGDIAKTTQDLDALKTLAKIQLYWNKQLGTHADKDPDLVRWKRTTATLRKMFDDKNWVDQQQDSNKESTTVLPDTDIYGYIYEDNQTKIKVNDEIIDITDSNGVSPDFITIGGISYRNCTVDQAEQFSWLGCKIVTDGVYFGDFKNNMIDGKWTKIWTDGSSYKWEWKDEKMNWSWTYTNKHGIKFNWNRSNDLYQDSNQSIDVATLNQYTKSIETEKAKEEIRNSNKVIQDTIADSIKQLEAEKKEMINIWWKDYKIKDRYVDVNGTIYKDCTNPAWDTKFSGKWFIKNIDSKDGLYIGDVVDNKPQGIWKLQYSNWDIYEWFLKAWHPNGPWKMIWKDGGKYKWNWKDGKMNWEWSYTNPHNVLIEWFFENNQYTWTLPWLLELFGWWKKISRDKDYMDHITDQNSVDNPWLFR